MSKRRQENYDANHDLKRIRVYSSDAEKLKSLYPELSVHETLKKIIIEHKGKTLVKHTDSSSDKRGNRKI